MPEARRLITSIDVDGTAGHKSDNDRRLSTSALHELAGGRRLTLLDDRGWAANGPSDIWSSQSVKTLSQTALPHDEDISARIRARLTDVASLERSCAHADDQTTRKPWIQRVRG